MRFEDLFELEDVSQFFKCHLWRLFWEKRLSQKVPYMQKSNIRAKMRKCGMTSLGSDQLEMDKFARPSLLDLDSTSLTKDWNGNFQDFPSWFLFFTPHLKYSFDWFPSNASKINRKNDLGVGWGFVLLKLCTIKFKRCLNHWPVRVVAMSVLRSKVYGRSHSDKLLQARGCWGGFLFMNYRNQEIVWINELFLSFHRHSVA